MLDWAFESFKNYTLFARGAVVEQANVWLGEEDTVPLVTNATSRSPCLEHRAGGSRSKSFLLIRDTPPVRMYVLNMFCMRGSRLWGSRLHRACAV